MLLASVSDFPCMQNSKLFAVVLLAVQVFGGVLSSIPPPNVFRSIVDDVGGAPVSGNTPQVVGASVTPLIVPVVPAVTTKLLN